MLQGRLAEHMGRGVLASGKLIQFFRLIDFYPRMLVIEAHPFCHFSRKDNDSIAFNMSTILWALLIAPGHISDSITT